MTPDRWQEVKKVFAAVSDLPASKRETALAEMCHGDAEMREEIDSLFVAAAGTNTSAIAEPLRDAISSAGVSKSAPLVFKDRYEVERELGRGGMGIVYFARDRALMSRPVVVKVLLRESGGDAWVQQKFHQEMEALARIEHPGVVSVLDHGTTPGGEEFLVAQYVEGETLRSAMEPGGMNLFRAAGILRQAGFALHAAHEKGVWHRDLKPENIMIQRLSGDDHVKLIDFGIARIQDSKFGGPNTKVAGSLAYMPPEQFAGRPSAASDIYALGVVAFELLTGHRPFPNDSMVHLASEEKAQPLPLRELRELPDAAVRAVLKAISFRPERRQATAKQFAEEIWQALGTTTGTGRDVARKSPVAGTLEMAHVLFTDLVGYSLLPTDKQKEYQRELQEVVSESSQLRASQNDGSLIILPTGDGMALSFFGDPTAPVHCAVEVAKTLKTKPHLQLRMGIHTGPVYRLADMNANANVAGGGINMAQRVMSCGDAGHILISSSMAELLSELTEWAPALKDLGEVSVKHGARLHLYNLCTSEAGNPTRPGSLGRVAPSRRRWLAIAGASAATAALAGTGTWVLRGRGAAGGAKPSIAVLPFEDLSEQKDQTYFSDGVAEEVLNTLAKIPGLQVSGRASSFRFRDRTADLREVGSQLHVNTLLAGSVRRQGSRVRISTQLLNAADGFQIWSNTFERELTDIFAIQEEIARSVASALKVTLLGGGFPDAARPVNPEAHNAYLQGMYQLEYRANADIDKAIGFFEQATVLDPAYANAWVGLSEARSRKAVSPNGGADEFRKAEEAVERALAIDGNLAAAYSARGWIRRANDWDWAGAEADFSHALSLEPGNALLVSRAALLYRMIGKVEQSITLNRRAIALEPLNANDQYYAGMGFYYAGLNGEARESLTECLRLVPERQIVHWWLGKVALAEHRYSDALKEMQAETHPIFKPLGLAISYHALGRAKESQERTEFAEKEMGDAGAFYMAEVYAFRGERDRAIELLEKSFALHQSAMTNIKGDPIFKPLEGDPRYQALLLRLKL